MAEEDSAPQRPSADPNSQGPRGDAENLRLLFVVPFAPRRDSRHGGRVVAQLLLRLGHRHRVALVHRLDPGAEPVESELEDACELVVPVRPTRHHSRWHERLDVLASPVTGFPTQAAAVRDPSLVEAARALAADWEPDVIQVEHDNLAYLGPRLRKDHSGTASFVLVCHEPGVLAVADQARFASGRHRLEHWLNLVAWRRYWKRTLPAFDAVVAFTDEDRAVDQSMRPRTFEPRRSASESTFPSSPRRPEAPPRNTWRSSAGTCIRRTPMPPCD